MRAYAIKTQDSTKIPVTDDILEETFMCSILRAMASTCNSQKFSQKAPMHVVNEIHSVEGKFLEILEAKLPSVNLESFKNISGLLSRFYITVGRPYIATNFFKKVKVSADYTLYFVVQNLIMEDKEGEAIREYLDSLVDWKVLNEKSESIYILLACAIQTRSGEHEEIHENMHFGSPSCLFDFTCQVELMQRKKDYKGILLLLNSIPLHWEECKGQSIFEAAPHIGAYNQFLSKAIDIIRELVSTLGWDSFLEVRSETFVLKDTKDKLKKPSKNLCQTWLDNCISNIYEELKSINEFLDVSMESIDQNECINFVQKLLHYNGNDDLREKSKRLICHLLNRKKLDAKVQLQSYEMIVYLYSLEHRLSNFLLYMLHFIEFGDRNISDSKIVTTCLYKVFREFGMYQIESTLSTINEHHHAKKKLLDYLSKLNTLNISGNDF